MFFSITNSLVIVLFLSGMIGMILLRTLHRDISRYNQLIDSGVSLSFYNLILSIITSIIYTKRGN